ncbi:uncharacterized protein LOC109852012 [Pseudomyrmex gracilis]|uniref:uncharacterized protein LOC109852012 n=1 Tax=Pseudomyrmex gracilis TaxID=219809 RepID=UPI000995C579|nr:uncharacterized protein LOC109852012 [Pseudomyrmex gracilis]
MTSTVFGFLFCAFITASFVDSYRSDGYNDHNNVYQDQNPIELLMNLLKNKENRRDAEDGVENWPGRWMPDRPDDPTPPPKILPKQENEDGGSATEMSHEMSHEWNGRMFDHVDALMQPNNEQNEYESVTEFPHEMYMGHVSPECDDAKTNLTVDWDHSPTEHTCYGHNFVPSDIPAYIYCETIPMMYKAVHKCMNQIIEYDDDVPLYGTHRPLWPVYGEYKYVPKQRWLHSLEHGAIVMLYHPCANPLEVERLRNLVKKCLWRHIITPYNYLDEDRPLALLSWGCKLTMSSVDPRIVTRFIRKKALRGPEQNANDGQFTDGLLTQSRIVTNSMDSVLCPNM